MGQDREQPERVRWSSRRLWISIAGVVAILVIAGVRVTSSQSKAPDEEPLPSLLQSIERKIEGILGLTPEKETNALTASGIIQVQAISVASESGGRIAEIPVTAGQSIARDDVLVRLDPSLLDAKLQAARAAVEWAQAGLEQAQAGARPGQIAVAQAQLSQAQAGRVAAIQAVSDTLKLVENPQDILLQIAVTQAQAEAAQHQVARALAIKDAAEAAKNRFEQAQIDLENLGGAGRHKVLVSSGNITNLPPDIVEQLPNLADGVYTLGNLELHIQGNTYKLYRWVNVGIPLQMHLTPNQWWQAWVGVNAALAQQEGYQSALAQLYTQQAHPQSLEAQADQAMATLAQAKAQVAVAQAQLDGLQAGATQQQIAALQARVTQAQTALDSLSAQRAKLEIVAPVDGTVLDLTMHPGEVAAPGATLLTVADLSEVQLVVYLPELKIGRVYLGQTVNVKVDSFPDRIFTGQISHIADQAEFMPRNVATKEERVNLVFAVEIRLVNRDGALKPGMPADATFENKDAD